MAKIYDQQTDFTQGGDNGQNTAASIQPIAGGESLWEDPLNRSPQNLRKRTEALRAAVDDLRYYADYDRSLILRSRLGKFTCTRPDPTGDPTGYALEVEHDDLWVYPTLTPGRVSGGREGGARMFLNNGGEWRAYAGTIGTDDLTFVATQTRGYADADDLAVDTNGLSLGANRLTISLVPEPGRNGGLASILVAVTGSPATKITIRYGTATPTYISDIRTKIATDTSSQGSYGLKYVLEAVSHSSAPTTTVPPLGITDAIFQGGYDAEAHRVRRIDLNNFFTAVIDGVRSNRLREGEGLALSFAPGPVQRLDVGVAKGGRRQSLFDLPISRSDTRDNTYPEASPNLFNTGREPEKIPGSVPLGKLLGGQFVFIDGTIVGPDPVSLGESIATLARLAAAGGASLIRYDGSPHTWIPAGTVENAIDTVDSYLWESTGATVIGYEGSTSGLVPAGKLNVSLQGLETNLARTAATTGAERVGFLGTELWNDATGLSSTTVQTAINELVSDLAESGTNTGSDKIGSPLIGAYYTGGNTGLDVPEGSVLDQIVAVTNDTVLGLNVRVSEYGHRMHGPNPIEKIFSETGPAGDLSGGGGQLIRAVLNAPPTSFLSYNQVEEQAGIYLQPLKDGAAFVVDDPVTVSGSKFVFSSMNSGRALLVQRYAVLNPSTPLHCVVSVTGFSAGYTSEAPLYFYATELDTASQTLTVLNLDGSTPTLTGLTGTGALTFYRTRIVGGSADGIRVRSMIPDDYLMKTLPDLSESHAEAGYFGEGLIKAGFDQQGTLRHLEGPRGAVWDKNTYTSFTPPLTGTGATVTSGVGILTVGNLTGMTSAPFNGVGQFYLGLPGAMPGIPTDYLRISTFVNATTIIVDNPTNTIYSSPTAYQLYRDTERMTDNILIKEDADLLKGIERTPVDATLNHHHDSRYALLGTIFYEGPQTLSLTSPWGSDIASLAVASTTTVTTHATIPTGFTKTAAILRAEVAGHTDLTGPVGETVRLRIGMRRNGLENENILALQHLMTTAPINASGSVIFGVDGGQYASNTDTLVLSDGSVTVTFEYDTGDGVATGRTPIPFAHIDSDATMASKLVTAINGVGPLQITAEVDVLNPAKVRLTNTLSYSGDSGNIPITFTASNPSFSVTIVGMAGGSSPREELYKSEQITVPVDSDKTFRMVILAKTSNLDTDVALTLTEIGAVITPTP